MLKAISEGGGGGGGGGVGGWSEPRKYTKSSHNDVKSVHNQCFVFCVY